jgi:hypothetical protein
MKNNFQTNPVNQAQFDLLLDAEIKRKEKLMAEFEKLELTERKRKKTNKPILQKKYERVTKGYFFIEKITGDHVHLIGENEKKLGILHVTPEISKLLRVSDELEGTFGFRNGYWRIHFLFCIANSTDDFMPDVL